MLVDLHTHTCRYSACSRFTPATMVKAAIAAGLDGMVLTEHDRIWGAEETEKLQQEFPQIRIFRGIEVTSDTGDHFLVYGVLEPELFYPGIPAGQLLQMVDDKGGCAVLAHAYRYSDRVPEAIFEHPLHAVEVMSSNIRRFARPRIKELASRLQIPMVAGSDGHAQDTIGMFATRFFSDDIADEKALAQAIKSGRFELHVNEEKRALANEKTKEWAKFAGRLLAQGESIEYINERFGISFSFLYALSNGWDVRL